MPKILVIDDINDNLIVLKALITDAFPGSIVYTAINGPQGIKLARSKNPDVILLDILMPGMDGFEVCQLLKLDDRVKDIPVIFITSLKNDKTNRIKALEAGADAIMSKSIDVTELTAQILAMVKIKKARIEKHKERDRLEALVIERTRQLEQELEERKQKEEELRANEDKFKYLFDYSPVGKSITMISGEINVNQAFCDVLGYSREEIQQKKWQEITHPDDIEITKKEIDSLLSGEKESVHFVKRFIQKSGSVIWVDLQSSLRRDKDNRPLYLISYLTDITERLQAEVRLKESETQFRELWGATVEGITIIDNGKITEVNDAMCQLFGYSHDQVIGRSMLDFAPTEMHNQISDRLRTGVMGRFETPSIKADGTRMMLEIFAKPFAYQGKQMRMVAIRDISERVHAEEKLRINEERLRTSLEASTDAIWEWDITTGETFFSPRWYELLGYKPHEIKMNSKEWVALAHPDDKDAALKVIYQAIADGSNYEVEFRTKHADGHWIWCSVKGKVTGYDANGKPVRLSGTNSDITLRKKTEIALQKSEERYRALVDWMPEAIAIHRDGILMYVNPAAIMLIGAESAGDLIGKPMLKFVHPDFHQITIEEAKKIANEGFVQQWVERRFIRIDRTIIDVELQGKSIVFDGEPAIHVAIRDITDRKLAEEALKTSKKLLEQTFEQSPVPMALVSMPDAIIRIANPACRYFLGINDEPSLINTSLFDLKPSWQDFNLLGAPGNMEELPLARSLRGLKTESEERCIIRNDGTIRYELVNSFPIFDDSGRIIAGHLIMIDITDRIKADQVQQVLYAISIAALSTIDLPELIEIIREQLSKLLDSTNFYIAFYDEKSGMLSTHYQKDEKDEIAYWPAEKSATGYVIKHQKSLLANESDVIKLCEAGEIEIVGTPSKIWLGVPLFVNKKVIGAIVVQSYDNPNAYTEKDQLMLEFISRQISISIERKKAEQEIKEALFKAQESDRLKSAFLANMSHEIRTPLNSIIGFSDLMLDPFFGPDQHSDFAAMIKENGNNLLAIISDIMDISKIEAGLLQIKKRPFSVNQLIADIYKEYSFKAIEKAIELKLDLSNPQEDVLIVSDENRLRQILVNLVGNAIKFTDKGFISIGFKIGEEVILFQVKDTGIGVPFYFREQIFERFRQVETAFTRKHGGNGLGLPISKSLVELLGGKIWMESEEGKGSTFFFTIPKHAI